MAEIKYLSNINLLQNELIFPRIQNLTAAPTTGNPTGAALEGQLYMNTVNHNLYVYDGTAWVDLTSTAYTFTLTADTGGTTGITDGTTVDIAGGSGLATVLSGSTVTVSLDITSLGAPVGGIVDADSFVVYDASGAVHTVVLASALKTYINAAAGTFSSFDITGDSGGPKTINDAEVVNFVGGTGIITTVSGASSPYAVTFDLDFTELTDMTASIAGTTEFILNNAGVESRKTANEIGLQFFDNTTSAFTTNLGTLTSVSAGNGMNFSTITTIGAVTLGTPGALTSSSTNAVTTNSHTHTIDISGFASTVLSDTANIVYTNASRTINVTHTIATGNNLIIADAPTIATHAANKGYVDGLLGANDAMIYKGTVGTGGTITIAAIEALTTYNAGWTYKVITASSDLFGNVVEIGDMLIAVVDRTGTGAVDADWTVIQNNIDGAVIGPISATNNAIALFDGVTGKLIKNSSVALGSFIPVAGASTQILQYSAAGTAKWVTVSNDVSIADGGAITIGANAVTYAKMQQASAGFTIIAKATTGAGNYTELAAAADSVLRRSASGDLAFGTLVTNNLGNNIVTYAKIQTMATQTFLGRNTAGTGNVEALTVAQMQALISPPASETVKGIVEEATDAEITAGTATGATGAKLFVTPAKLATRLGTSGAENAFTRRKTFTCAAATTTTCTHSFNNRFVQVQVFRTDTPWDLVMTEVTLTSTTQCVVTFNVAPTAAEYTIIVIG